MVHSAGTTRCARLRFGQFLSLRLAFTRACGASMKRTLGHNTRRHASCLLDRCLAFWNVSTKTLVWLKNGVCQQKAVYNCKLRLGAAALIFVKA